MDKCDLCRWNPRIAEMCIYNKGENNVDVCIYPQYCPHRTDNVAETDKGKAI